MTTAKAVARRQPARRGGASTRPPGERTAAGAATAAERWATRWLDAVAAGASTMSQRSLASIEQRGGGLPAVRKLARQRGVHLLLVKVDDGAEVVAASRSPFKVVC